MTLSAVSRLPKNKKNSAGGGPGGSCEQHWAG